MKMMAATDSAKEQGVPLGDYTKLEVEDSVNEFLRDAKDDAISNYVDPDVEPEDIIIHFDGTPKEFAKEFRMHVLVARPAISSMRSSISRTSTVSAVVTLNWLSHSSCPHTSGKKGKLITSVMMIRTDNHDCSQKCTRGK